MLIRVCFQANGVEVQKGKRSHSPSGRRPPKVPERRTSSAPAGRKFFFPPSPFKSLALGQAGAFAFDWTFVMNTSSHDTISRVSCRAQCSRRVSPFSLPRVHAFADLFPFLRLPSSALCCSLRFEVLTINSRLTRDNSRFKLDVLVRSTSISPSLVRRTLIVSNNRWGACKGG